MSDEKTKAIKQRNNSAPSSTRSNSTEIQKTGLKAILKAELKNIKNNLPIDRDGTCCGFNLEKFLSKSKYKPLIPREKIIEDDSLNLIECTDEDFIHSDSDDEIDISDENRKSYDLDEVNCDENKKDKSSKNKVGTDGNENKKDKEIEENIKALKEFIQNLQIQQENYCSGIDYRLIIRKDINALIIYIEVNYGFYEYTFKSENQKNFLDEIIILCEEKFIIPFH